MNALVKAFTLLFFVVTLFACGGGEEKMTATENTAITTGMKKILSTNTCSDGDVPDSLLGDYLPASQLQTSVREWSAVRGYLYVSGKTIIVSFRFDEAAINTFKLRTDFAFEIDIVDLDSVIKGDWKYTAEFGKATVKKDIAISDQHHQLSLIVLNPHLLEKNTEYKVRFDLDQSVQNRGRLKLNTDLSVSFSGSISPLCINPFFRSYDSTYPGNYFKLEIEQYSAFWYDPNSSSGVCWTDQATSGFGACVSPRGAELELGNLSLISDASGHVGLPGIGIETLATEDPIPEPPDFVTKRVWLQLPWSGGGEIYKYGLGESFDTKAQAANIGDGPCKSGEISTITGHFYLSKGYKEDPHSGDGAWRRVDSTVTDCDNLKPGDTNTETKNTKISDWITTPGIYNIVYCIDHPQDDHNNGGDHVEKHESNNCTTEAVFEVTANQIENAPNVDFTVSGFTVLQAPVYAGDYIRLGAWITNAGTVNATTDIRSSYTVSCNGGPTSVLTDDGTMASTMTAGASAWEEIQTPVLMPNVVGTCTLTFTADYLGAQAETDETNNSTSLTVTLAPRPAPNLVITRYEDKVGCCTTNTGAAPKPRIWIRNDGSAAPGANVSVVYQVSSPVATGGLYQVIGYGTIEPRELPPGGTDEDQMDCDGCWRIPKTSAWKKQWHNFRACLRTDGAAPTPSTGDPSPGEVCAVYSRYSKE